MSWKAAQNCACGYTALKLTVMDIGIGGNNPVLTLALRAVLRGKLSEYLKGMTGSQGEIMTGFTGRGEDATGVSLVLRRKKCSGDKKLEKCDNGQSKRKEMQISGSIDVKEGVLSGTVTFSVKIGLQLTWDWFNYRAEKSECCLHRTAGSLAHRNWIGVGACMIGALHLLGGVR